MKTYLQFLICLAWPAFISSQSNLEWDKTFGPDHAPVERALVAEVGDEQLALFAELKSSELWMARIDRSGELDEARTFDFAAAGMKAVIPNESGFLLAGYIGKGRKRKAVLWRLDNEGRNLHTVSEVAGQGGMFTGLARNLKGAVFASAQVEQKAALFQVEGGSSVVHSIWRDTSAVESTAADLAVNPFGDIFLTGHRRNRREHRLVVWKFNAAGQLVWEKILADGNTMGKSILVMDNGDILVAGDVFDRLGSRNMQIIKLAPNGRLLWQKQYGGPGDERAVAAIQTLDRDFTVAGAIASFGARTTDIWLNKLDMESGARLDTLSVRLGGTQRDEPSDLLTLQNGDYVVVMVTTTNKIKARLRYHRISENLCENRLLAGQDFQFSPILDNELAMADEKYRFQGMLLSRIPLEEFNVQVRSEQAGRKGLGIIRLEERPTLPGQKCYYLEKTLFLKEGVNTIKTNISKNDKSFQDSLMIYNLPRRPDLHLLSIGIVYDDLRYTANDAQDFARIFQEQEGRLYENVYATLLNSREETAAAGVVEKIIEMKQREIGAEDVLMVFISSHGEVLDGEFILPGADYNPENIRTSIRFRQEVLDVLDQIECKKILFIDACKSGISEKGSEPSSFANPQLAENILRILDEKPGLAKLSSSSGDEFSYEHPELENGLFTAAIEEGLNERPTEVDRNGDRIITLGELAGYLKVRVPEMVRTLYTDLNKRQTPALPEPGLSADFPLFYISY